MSIIELGILYISIIVTFLAIFLIVYYFKRDREENNGKKES